MTRDDRSATPQAAVLLGETERYFDPVWRVEVLLSPLEQELLAHPFVRRLAHIAHAGAASLLSVQTYSRLEHSLGVLALVSHLRPEDRVMRVAALVHDVGHLPLSHTLERAFGVSHHDLGDAKVRRLRGLFGSYGLDAEEVIEAISGRGSSALGRGDGTMNLDHFESYVRSAHVHGTTREDPRETLGSIELLDAGVSCDETTAGYLFALMAAEAERQSNPHNVRANAVTSWLARRAGESGSAKSISEISEMIDRDLWSWLESVPGSREVARDLLFCPERWQVRATAADEQGSDALLYEISRFYLDPPLVKGQRAVWPPRASSVVELLHRRFLIEERSHASISTDSDGG